MKKLTICLLFIIAIFSITGCSNENKEIKETKPRNLYYLTYNEVTSNLIEHNITTVDIEVLPADLYEDIKIKAENNKNNIIETLKFSYPDDWEEYLQNLYGSVDNLYTQAIKAQVETYIFDTFAEEPLPEVTDLETFNKYKKIKTQALIDFRNKYGVVSRIISGTEVIFDDDTNDYYDLNGIAAFGKCADDKCIETEYERIDTSKYEVQTITTGDADTNEDYSQLLEMPISGCSNTLGDLDYIVDVGAIYINKQKKFYVSFDSYFWLVTPTSTGIEEYYNDVGYLDENVEYNNASLTGVLGENCYRNGEW